MKKTVVKRFVLKGETVRTLRGIELLQVVGAQTTDACGTNKGCPPSFIATAPCQCTAGGSGCASPDQST